MLCASRHPRQAVCASDGAARHRLAIGQAVRARWPARLFSISSWHLPSGIVDRRASPPIRALEPDQIATVTVRVEAHQPGFGRRPYRVLCTDDTGTLTLVYFNVKGDQLARLLPVGAERVVSGRVEFYGGMPQMAHPDLVLRPDELDRLKPIEPVYPLTAGLSPRVVQKAVGGGARPPPGLAGMDRSGIARAARLARLGRGGPPGRTRPKGEADLSPTTPARERLAYDEIFASQLAVALARARRHRQKGRAIVGTGALDRPSRSRARLCV